MGRRAARDALRERRLDEVTSLAERLLFDIARMAAGHHVDLDAYVSPDVGHAMRDALRPFREAGHVVRPDFGLHAELRVEGNLLDEASPVAAVVDFEDRSVRESAMGGRLPASRRRVRLAMSIRLDRGCITGAQVVLPS